MNTTGLRVAIELTELGAQLLAQRYRREHPGASEEEVRRWGCPLAGGSLARTRR
jgi:hypothetical protein